MTEPSTQTSARAWQDIIDDCSIIGINKRLEEATDILIGLPQSWDAKTIRAMYLLAEATGYSRAMAKAEMMKRKTKRKPKTHWLLSLLKILPTS